MLAAGVAAREATPSHTAANSDVVYWIRGSPSLGSVKLIDPWISVYDESANKTWPTPVGLKARLKNGKPNSRHLEPSVTRQRGTR